MVYARVIVDSPTAKIDTFTYSVTVSQMLEVKPGILVDVPFHGRKRRAVVAGLTKKSSVGKAKIKPIARIYSSKLAVTLNQLELARWLADYYGVSLGKALFAMVPSI